MNRSTLAWCLVAGAMWVSSPARADRAAYAGIGELVAVQGNVRAEHHHDWSKREAFVRLVEIDSGHELLRVESPPLTTLWLSPDARYVVGLSQIKLANPHQIFIANRDGSYVHREQMTCADRRIGRLPCGETVSNHIEWYDAMSPELRLIERGGRPAEISVDSLRPSDGRVVIPLGGQ